MQGMSTTVMLAKKRINKENMGPLLNGVDDLVMVGTKKAEVLTRYSLTRFPSSLCLE